MLYNINEHQHEDRFSDEDDIRNKVSIIFRSDYDVINQHYLPNLMRHHGKVEKNQVRHWDYPFIEKMYKQTSKKRKNSKKSN